MNGYLDGLEDLSLIDEFELMLDLEEDSKTTKTIDQSKCLHNWTVVGKSPYSGEEWVNCAKCDMRKEDFEWNKRYNNPPPIKKEHKNVDLWGI